MSVKLKIVGWAYAVACGAALIVGSVLCLGELLSGDKNSRALEYIGPMFLMAALFYFVPGLAGGIGLLYARNWARVLLIVLSAVSLLFVPVGTVWGGLALWVLLGTEANRFFAELPVTAPVAPAPPAPSATLTPRQAALILCGVGVAALFVVVLGTGSRLTGQPSPDWIPTMPYITAVVLLAATLVIGVRWLMAEWWPDLSGTFASPRQAKRMEQQRDAERRRRLTALAANPVTYKYVAMIDRGESWDDAQIAYNENRHQLATCVHLHPIERAMRDSGIHLKYESGLNVRADCQIDDVALKRRFGQVAYIEEELDERGAHAPFAWIACMACRSNISTVHRNNAAPATPVFPTAGPGG